MKTFLLLLLTAAALHANPRFAITKSTVDGGGARAAETVSPPAAPRFTLTGTIGQPEAAPRFVSADNRFAVEPGFWPGYTVVPTPGAPELTMRPSPLRGHITLAWPVASTGYLVEQSPDMAHRSWTPVELPVVDTATEHTITYPLDAGRMFFRLSVQAAPR